MAGGASVRVMTATANSNPTESNSNLTEFSKNDKENKKPPAGLDIVDTQRNAIVQ
jgi:hypothetical protein